MGNREKIGRQAKREDRGREKETGKRVIERCRLRNIETEE